MAGPTLPPRAYTKEVLAQAFEWLKQQPASIRELATSADNLVSLYETAMRRSAAQKASQEETGSSPSSQAFKADLKNLAQDLKLFEEGHRAPAQQPVLQPVVEAPPPPVTTVAKPLFRSGFLNQFSEQLAAQSQPVIRSTPAAENYQRPPPAPPPTVVVSPPPPAPVMPPPAPTITTSTSTITHQVTTQSVEPQSVFDLLDERTRDLCRDVKDRLNLSSETEALRLLISMGYDKIRDILPR